jgi:hypothetical protein
MLIASILSVYAILYALLFAVCRMAGEADVWLDTQTAHGYGSVPEDR